MDGLSKKAPLNYGRDRENLTCFTLPDNFPCKENGNTYLRGGNFKVLIKKDPLVINIKIKDKRGNWNTALSDRETGSWYWDARRNSTFHYQERNINEKFYGLGEKAGKLDRSFRRFQMSQKDALGYNAELSDPLYKSFPWLMIRSIDNQKNDVGVLYDTLAPAVIDCGSEHSNYHEKYRYFETETKGIDLYVLTNNNCSLPAMINKLTGMPPLPPKWSLGFQFSSMELADHPLGEKSFFHFFNLCNKYKIPISALHFSSGYTLKKGKRYVFTWDKSRYPNPKKFLFKLKDLGIHLVANVKPALLDDHPLYEEAKLKNIFINDKQDQPSKIQFWGGKGSLIDFTKSSALKWWKKNVEEQLLATGFEGIWNDNNEYDLKQVESVSKIENQNIDTEKISSAQALMMVKNSYESVKKFYPNKRIYCISRSGCLGIQRWAETWTGDNKTSWHTLKWNLAMGLGLSLSGIGRFGHDIGGFTGKKTDKELLIRWVQAMLLHPRFHMNSWKPSIQNDFENDINFGSQINLPWMHKEITPLISKLLNLRYELLPILYSALWVYHHKGEPPIRPLFLDYPEQKIYDQDDVYALTDRIIVAPVVEEGHRKRSLYLPYCDEGWYDYYNMKFVAQQGYVELKAPLEKLPIIIKGGTIIPRAKTPWFPSPHSAPIKEIVIYPALNKGKNLQNNLPIIFDDGESLEYQKGNFKSLVPNLLWDNKTARLSFKSSGSGILPERRISINKPPKWNVKILSLKGFNLMNETK